jgi:uncharacterized Zn-binding protein involved in type VI secretion
MVTRYYIREGDKTTAGGTVIEGSTADIVDDRGLAFEGYKVSCPACHSVGQIVCDGPRWAWSGENGREAALSDDLCLCKCSPPPRLLASQTTMSMHMDALPGAGAGGAAAAEGQFALPHDEQFLLRDKATGEVLANVPYQVRTASGDVISGVTDSSGRTQRINTTAAETLVFHLLHGGEA